MARKAVSSVIAGLLVIFLALVSAGAITLYFYSGLYGLSSQNALQHFLLLKDGENLQALVSNGKLEVVNQWTNPSRLTYLMLVSSNGSVSLNPLNAEIVPGANFTLPVSLQPGYSYAVLTSYGNEFWASYGVSNPALQKFYLTVKENAPLGSADPAPGTYVYPYGSKVSVSAAPDSGYCFINWTGSGYMAYSGSNPQGAVYMWSNVTETAFFGVEINFTASLPSSLKAVQVNSSYYNVPVSFKVPYGDELYYSWSSPVYVSGSERYTWESSSGLDAARTGFIIATHSGIIDAKYQLQYLLTMSAAPANAGSTYPPAGSYWENSGSAVVISASANPGYAFYEWEGSGSGSYSGYDDPASVIMNGPLNETAEFFVWLTVSSGRGGSVSYSWSGGSGTVQSGGTSTFAVPPGTRVTLTAEPYSGLIFDGWVGSGNGSYSGSDNPVTLTVDGSIKEAAFFEAALTVSVTGMNSGAQGTAVTVDGHSYSYSQLPVKLYFLPGSVVNYSFSSPVSGAPGTRFVWNSTSGIASSESGSFVMPGSPAFLTGNYRLQFYLSVEASPANAGSISPGSGWYGSGSQVTISAFPSRGYGFACWSGNGSGSYSGPDNPATITMDSPITETANFNVGVSVLSTCGGTGFASAGNAVYSSNSTFYVPPGTSVKFSETPLTGYQFVEWSGTRNTSLPGFTMVADSPVTEEAVFRGYITVTFSAKGLNSSAAGTVLTVEYGGTTYALQYSNLPFTMSVPYGSLVSFTFSTQLKPSSGYYRWVWSSASGLSASRSGTINVTQSGSVTGNYAIDYEYVFQENYLPPGSGWSVSADGQNRSASAGQNITVWSASPSLFFRAYNVTYGGKVYEPAPEYGTARPGLTNIYYELSVSGVVQLSMKLGVSPFMCLPLFTPPSKKG